MLSPYLSMEGVQYNSLDVPPVELFQRQLPLSFTLGDRYKLTSCTILKNRLFGLFHKE
ncbi:hypothetical protein [Microcoleus sp. K5-D4]|uniref:hypothetical protein n=1 Tax=Microcoleus sp. K5-D4 TaxID=2818801 RepID=UPI002FD6B523